MIKLILFISFLSVALAVRFSVPLQKTENVRERFIREGRHKEFLDVRQQGYAEGRQVIYDTSDQFYLIDITLGTPYQKFLVAIDTMSSNLWVTDAHCTSANCTKDSTTGILKNTYNSAASKTFMAGGTFWIPYDRDELSGNLGKEKLGMAGIVLENQDFGSAIVLPPIFPEQPVEGVLGLGWPSSAIKGTISPMRNLLPELDEPIVTIWIQNRSIPAVKPAGAITYGGFDTISCSRDINWIPLINDSSWAFMVNAFGIGTYYNEKLEMAIPATGSGWTGVPFIVLSNIVKQTKALYDWTNEVYTIPCSQINNKPMLSIYINGTIFKIAPQSYVIDINLPNGQCVLSFFGTFSDPAWILGDAFLRSYCHVLDYGKVRLGLTEKIQGLVD